MATRDEAGSHLAFRPDLEGLRGVAILLVAIYHVGLPLFTGGYIGVDVFFVLSGYLITSLLVKEVQAKGRVNLVRFYARRARRLLPAAALVLIATLVATSLVYAPFEQQLFARAAFGTALYASNLWFAIQSTQYLAADTAANPFLHTWSLAVEEQFYFVWPLLVGLTLAGIAGLRGGQPRYKRLATVMAVASVVSFGVEIWTTRIAQPWAFFGPWARAWEFGIGGLGALAGWRLGRGGREAFAWAGLAAIVVPALMFDRATVFPGYVALIPVLGTVAVVALHDPASPTGVARFLSTPVMQWVGRHSYSWYLWHWPVLIIGGVVFGTSLPVRLALLAFSLLLSAITLVVLEHPIRSSPTVAKHPRLVVAAALVVTAIVATVSRQTLWRASAAAGLPSQEAFTLASQDIPTLYGTGCHVEFFATDAQDCSFGAKGSATSIVLFGDSHAAQWFPALERIAVENRWRLVPLTKSACPAAAVDVWEPKLGRLYGECAQWRDAALERIIRLRPLAVVMASSSPSNYRTPTGSRVGIDGITQEDWLAGTRRTLTRLSGAGIRTLVMRDTPLPGFDVPTCLARASWNPRLFSRACAFDRAAALDTAGYAAEVDAAAGVANVTVVDMTDSLCGAQTCESSGGGMVFYRDGNHLTARFAARLAPVLLARLQGSAPALEPVATRGGALY